MHLSYKTINCVWIFLLVMSVGNIQSADEMVAQTTMLQQVSNSPSITSDAKSIENQHHESSSEIQILSIQAKNAIEDKKYDLALQYYQYILQIDQEFEEAVHGVQHIEKILSSQKNKVIHHEEIKKLMFYAQNTYQKKQFDEAIGYLNQILEIQSNHLQAQQMLNKVIQEKELFNQKQKNQMVIEGLFESARVAMKNEEYEAALACYQAIVDLNPSDEIAYKGLVETQYVIELKNQELLDQVEIERLILEANHLQQSGNLKAALYKIKMVLKKDEHNVQALEKKNEIEKALLNDQENQLRLEIEMMEKQQAIKEAQQLYLLEQVVFEKSNQRFIDLKNNIKNPLTKGMYDVTLVFKNSFKNQLKDKPLKISLVSNYSERTIVCKPLESSDQGWVTDKIWKGFLDLSASDYYQQSAGIYHLEYEAPISIRKYDYLSEIKIAQPFEWGGMIKIKTTHQPYGKSLEGNKEIMNLTLDLTLENMRGRKQYFYHQENLTQKDSLDYRSRFQSFSKEPFENYWIDREITLEPFSIDMSVLNQSVYQWEDNTVTDESNENINWINSLVWNANDYINHTKKSSTPPLQLKVYLTQLAPDDLVYIYSNYPNQYASLIETKAETGIHLPVYKPEMPWRYLIEINPKILLKNLSISAISWDAQEYQSSRIFVTGYASSDGASIQGYQKYKLFGENDLLELEFDLRIRS